MFETGLGGADIQVGVGANTRADAQIVLEGIKTRVTQSKTEESNYVVWQRQTGSGSTVETMTLPKFTGPTAPVFSGPVLAQIPEGDFKTQVQNLSQQPGMSYLQQLAQRQDVSWQPMQLAFEQWSYDQQGLTQAGAALVAVVVAVATNGAGASLLGSAGTTTTVVNGAVVTSFTTAGLMANAAVASLAAQASITLINNGGDIGKTLKEMGKSDTVKAAVAAALTAGALDKIGVLDSIKNLQGSEALSDKLTLNLINAGGRSLTNTAITGGSLEGAIKDALMGALVDTAHGEVASQIKVLESEYLAHKLAHALAGCAAGAAAGGACREGAIGAAVGEIVADLMPPANGLVYSEAEKTKVLTYSKLVAGGVSAYAGGNAQTAITTAETAVRNNAFLPVLLGIAWLADKAWTAYDVAQDVAAIRDGQKTVEQVAQEKGEEYVAAVVLGNVGRYGVKAVKVGGKWVQSKDSTLSNVVESRASYTPNAGVVGNMGVFLKSSGFGAELGRVSQKTHKIYQSQTVYKANEAIGDFIKAGDQFYLDARYMNHLEVFDSNNKVEYVLNLDGSINVPKTEFAKSQGRVMPKG